MMKPLFQIALLASLVWIPFTSSATTPSHPIEIKLQQAVDGNCDGIVSESSERKFAIPGACILYTITATNHGNEAVFNITLSGKIPQYTKLFSPLPARSNKSSSAAMLINSSMNKEPLLQQVFSRLDPGEEQAIVMKYTVRIL